MQKNDLKQISNLLDETLDKKFRENNKNLVTKDDLKSTFKENNKKIFKKIDGVKNELLDSMQDEFSNNTKQHNQMNKRFDKIDLELKKKITKNDLDDWEFSKSFETDIDALKYVNINKLKTLPHRNVIIKELVKNRLK